MMTMIFCWLHWLASSCIGPINLIGFHLSKCVYMWRMCAIYWVIISARLSRCLIVCLYFCEVHFEFVSMLVTGDSQAGPLVFLQWLMTFFAQLRRWTNEQQCKANGRALLSHFWHPETNLMWRGEVYAMSDDDKGRLWIFKEVRGALLNAQLLDRTRVVCLYFGVIRRSWSFQSQWQGEWKVVLGQNQISDSVHWSSAVCQCA